MNIVRISKQEVSRTLGVLADSSLADGYANSASALFGIGAPFVVEYLPVDGLSADGLKSRLDDGMTIDACDNDAEYIPFDLTGSSLSFDGKLTLALDMYERDNPVHIDICYDRDKNLVMGVIPTISDLYVAQIDIPARQYAEAADGEAVEDGGEGGGGRAPEPIPFSTENVTLTLWGQEDSDNV